ncbi:ParB/RepB/Spo0J family partition protein [Eubacteriales bacterium OttesenSCG-928-N13]|nr:ParB/RepB/Spo0J family partition protein [Eubacteriales bacterium OttesenSCG-928-N13]
MQQFQRDWQGQRRLMIVPIEQIQLSKARLRGDVDMDSIRSLAESIRQHGLISPIIVRATGEGYELIAGERRLRALKSLGLHLADAFVVDAGDMDAMFMALVENLQREQLHYMEEAEAFRAMIRDYQLSQQQLAERIGKSQPMVANRLRLLSLSHAVRAQLMQYALSERHARALLKLPGEQNQLKAIRAAHEQQMSVRQLEAWIEQLRTRPRQQIKMYVRDHRMFVNTVMDAVKALRRAGVNASGRVVEGEDQIEVIVTLPKIR